MERSPLCYAVLEYAHSLIGAREEKRGKMREKEEASLAQWNAIFRQRKRKFPTSACNRLGSVPQRSTAWALRTTCAITVAISFPSQLARMLNDCVFLYFGTIEEPWP